MPPSAESPKKSSKKPADKQPARRTGGKPAAPPDGPDGVKVSDTTVKTCKPFVLQVMVFAPKSGYKVEVNVEKTCTPEADAVWKLVFDLYRKPDGGGDFEQLVHVSYTGGTPVEQQGIEATASRGINGQQADALINRLGPAVLDLENSKDMSPQQLREAKTEVKAAARDVATFAL